MESDQTDNIFNDMLQDSNSNQQSQSQQQQQETKNVIQQEEEVKQQQIQAQIQQKKNEKKKKKQQKQQQQQSQVNKQKDCQQEEEIKQCCQETKQDQQNNQLQKNNNNFKLCYKCKTNKAVYKWRAYNICHECFLSQYEHRIRSAIALECNIRKGERVLICFSGGPSSLALLLIIHQSLNYQTNSNRKQLYVAEVLHIDEECLYQQSQETIQQNQQKIKLVQEKCGFKLHTIKFQSLYNSKETQNQIDEDNQAQSKLLHIISQFKENGSCREDLIQFFKLHLILKFAQENNYNRVILGTNAQKSAAKIFSLMAKGRGVDVEHEVKYISNIKVFPSQFVVSICKPQRDILESEVMTYLFATKNLDYALIREQSLCELSEKNSLLPGNGNLDWLMENFMTKILIASPGAVHTIVNTSDLVVKKYKFNEDNQICSLCLGFRDTPTNILELNNFQGQQLDKENVDQKSEIQKEDAGIQFEKQLCFGCKRLIQTGIILGFNKDQQVSYQYVFQLLPQIIQQKFMSQGKE